MKRKMSALLALGFVAVATSAVAASELTLPTPEQARSAFMTMFGDAKMFANAQLALGTCLPVPKAPHPGQISCTVSVLSPGGSSETQADFYEESGKWASQPATVQGLPFPDPKLMSAHWAPPATKH